MLPYLKRVACNLSAALLIHLCVNTTALSANLPSAQNLAAAHATLSPYQAQIEQRMLEFAPFINDVIKQLNQLGLPQNLAFIPMLESSLDPNAVSHANAKGIWQLMPATAKRFGLIINHQQDERLDPKRSTHAALQYLAFLYRKFDRDISLTLAAYNAGEGRLARAIGQSNTRQFSDLPLPSESRQYVSRFYALNQLINLDKIKTAHFEPFLLFAAPSSIRTKPIIDLTPLKPLIQID
ncbi:Transglycosylase SLT domain-containing protein [Vibrio xiamenensis]|uniref:Transglycosylase SLT domain-containing protein n=1 Tax=Vibrio xiamenensis TaxID=861298 RepID=A0A1G7Y4Y9_9VIBR|nr:lytic transglycosylase domain-containing protein [Vibrio xiamenensis]SDG91050.1 Transglycosylase SLT domain-containing protein [Vibrio xiamenensis]